MYIHLMSEIVHYDDGDLRGTKTNRHSSVEPPWASQRAPTDPRGPVPQALGGCDWFPPAAKRPRATPQGTKLSLE